MFSNRLIRSLAFSSDEERLQLSEKDWHLVLEANKGFSVSKEQWVGNSVWGRSLLARIDKFSRPLSFKNSLELCCGNGFMFFSLKDICDLSDCHYIDISVTQTDAFVQRCNSANVSKPDIICSDIGRLPFEDCSLDLVYGNSFLHHLPDVGKYLTEVCRVLKPGGRFIAFHEPTSTAPFWETFPRSIYKDIDDSSLTDIWLIRPKIIANLAIDCCFSHVDTIPNGIFASLFITPLQMVLAKCGFSYQTDTITILRTLCDKLDRYLPMFIRIKYAPSIAIIAEK